MSDRYDSSPQGEQQEIEAPQPPEIVLTASSDRMEMELQLRRHATETLKPTVEAVMEQLAEAGVVFGIREDVIRELCESPSFDDAYTIARGEPVGRGEDGYLVYHVEERTGLKPKIREDGTADYRDLGYIQNVREGQTLCEIHPPTQGADGKDIYGNVLEGIWGTPAVPPKGKATLLNEEGTLLVAECDGNAQLERGIIHVHHVMRINGNIDNSTGDLDFLGDMMITGDVVSGFRVKASGSITVNGSVEGAGLEAGGDIVVNVGINGMNRGSLISGGSIKCKYIQSCFIRAEQDIIADSIMYCSLECAGNVELGGKRATLIGGKSLIAGKLTAKTIGTDSHIATYITMASSGMGKNQEILELNQKINDLDVDNRKLLQVMARYEDLLKKGKIDQETAKAILQVKQQYLDQVQQRNDVQTQVEAIKREQMEASKENSFITCTGRIHAGVQIVFGPLLYNVQNSFVNSRVQVVDEEIAVLTL